MILSFLFVVCFVVGVSAIARRVNVLGEALQECSTDPMTGYTRTGFCDALDSDRGAHFVCVELTEEFLAYSASVGNDLSSPAPQYGFPGLNEGDRWCLCALRWRQAMVAGVAPIVDLDATPGCIKPCPFS